MLENNKNKINSADSMDNNNLDLNNISSLNKKKIQKNSKINNHKKEHIKDKKNISSLKKKHFVSCFFVFLIIFIVFIVIAIVSLGQEAENISRFGIDVYQYKTILSLIIHTTFGLIFFILGINIVLNIFKFIFINKEEKKIKRKTIISIIFHFIFIVILLILWLMISERIGHIKGDIKITKDIIAINRQTKEQISLINVDLPIEIEFSAENITTLFKEQNKEIILYHWSLDGSGQYRAMGEKVSYTYKEIPRGVDGTIPIKLKIAYKDASGEEGEEIISTVMSIGSMAPVIKVDVNQTKGQIPFTVTFDASASYDPDAQTGREKDIEILWDLNENGQYTDAEGIIVQKEFNTTGVFNIGIKAIDLDGNASFKNITINAEGDIDSPSAIIRTNTVRGKPPLNVQFEAFNPQTYVGGNIVKYEWDFGDGSRITQGKNTNYTFRNPGEYTVNLRLTDDRNNVGEENIIIYVEGVNHPPKAVIETSPNFSTEQQRKIIRGFSPLNVEFDASKSTDPDGDIIRYEWDLNGNRRYDFEGLKAEYTYLNEGEYEVGLKVTDSVGNYSEDYIIIIVENVLLHAKINAKPIQGIAPLTVEFDALSSFYKDGNIIKYEWNFGDGSPTRTAGAQIRYIFKQVGTYTVKLNIFTNDGKSKEDSIIIEVSEQPLIAKFESSVTEGVAPLLVRFDPSLSKGIIHYYEWNFGDGNISTDISPTHTFRNSGVYTVSLKVIDNKNIVDIYTKQIIVR